LQITANYGDETLDIHKREGDSLSLIIMDLIIPVMVGRMRLKETLRLNPNAKVIMPVAILRVNQLIA
jgi:hypothetical protein